MEQEKQVGDVAADYLHNYPDFKRDFAKGFFLGESDGKYYFYERGLITNVEEYNVPNNISNFFSGSIVRSNGVRYFPSKMVLEAFVREQTLEAFKADGCSDCNSMGIFHEGGANIECSHCSGTGRRGHVEISANFPFIAEQLCLETIRRVEQALPLSEGINGWHHFVVRLEELAVSHKGKIVQIEGIDHYLFAHEEDLVIQFATADDAHTFSWKFAEPQRGFKVSKKLMVKLIERQKFSV
jgi:hypothetical protein